MSIESRNLQHQLTEQSGGCVELATHIASAIGILARDIQALSRTLHPKMLEDLGLVAAIRSEGRRLETLHGLKFMLRAGAIEEPVGERALHLFRIFQEASTNILKHANATCFEVTLDSDGQEFVMEIRDDGQGLQLHDSQEPSGSLGLISMRERCQMIGAELSMVNTLPKGSCLKLTMLQEKSRRKTAAGESK